MAVFLGLGSFQGVRGSRVSIRYATTLNITMAVVNIPPILMIKWVQGSIVNQLVVWIGDKEGSFLLLLFSL